MQTGRVFLNGDTQAIRLPKDLRIEDDEVVIKRVGDMLVLFPRQYGTAGLKATLDAFDADFAIEREQPVAAEKRGSA